jgi:hypothetical protein
VSSLHVRLIFFKSIPLFPTQAAQFNILPTFKCFIFIQGKQEQQVSTSVEDILRSIETISSGLQPMLPRLLWKH